MTKEGSGTGLEPTKTVIEDKEKGESEPTKQQQRIKKKEKIRKNTQESNKIKI